MTDPKNDPSTPLEQLNPVDVTEVNEEGEQPPKEWGKDGGGSDEDPNQESEEAPQDGQ